MSAAHGETSALVQTHSQSTRRRTHLPICQHSATIPNGDHSFNALNNKLNLQYRDLLEHLKDKDPSYYYSDVLIPNGKTLKDFIGG